MNGIAGVADRDFGSVLIRGPSCGSSVLSRSARERRVASCVMTGVFREVVEATEFAATQRMSAMTGISIESSKHRPTSKGSTRVAAASHCARTAALLLLLGSHSLSHQLLNVITFVPVIVMVNDLLAYWTRAGFDLHLVVVAQMAFAGYMGEQMANVGESRFLGTNVAM